MPQARKSKPLYLHHGYLFRFVKKLSDGSELLYCNERKTKIGCSAVAHRKDGLILVRKPHIGHDGQEELAQAKLVRHNIRQIAEQSTISSKELIDRAREEYGNDLNLCGSNDSLARMIKRVRSSQLSAPKIDQHGEEGIECDSRRVKEEQISPEHETSMEGFENFESLSGLEDTLEQSFSTSDESVTIPSVVFLSTMQNMISEAVRQSHYPTTDEIHSASHQTTSSMLARTLRILASHSSNPVLKQRTETLVGAMERNIVELDLERVDTVLEATLNSFESFVGR